MPTQNAITQTGLTILVIKIISITPLSYLSTCKEKRGFISLHAAVVPVWFEVPLAMTMKIVVLCGMWFRIVWSIAEDGGKQFLRTLGKSPPDYTASHRTRQQSSQLFFGTDNFNIGWDERLVLPWRLGFLPGNVVTWLSLPFHLNVLKSFISCYFRHTSILH